MIAVIFEVQPKSGRSEEYFKLAADLGTHLQDIDGFISVERFASILQPGKFLSLSFWRDETAIERWRAFPQHRRAQQTGRNAVFADYRLRIASVIRDYGFDDREQAPADSRDAF